MKKYDLLTPEGTRDLLFDECAARRIVEEKLRKIFENYGYSEVVTPGVEFYDVFNLKARYFSQESMYKLSDSKGRLLVIRPDSTMPIARLAATRLREEPLPLKLFYNQTIFRINPKNSGRDDEITQSGIEIIGGEQERADFEVLTLAVEALKACAVDEFRFEIGDSALFKALIAKLGSDDEEYEEIRSAIETKNYPEVGKLLEKYDGNIYAKALYMLPKMFGGAEVFEKAASTVVVDAETEKILGDLRRTYDYLCSLGVKEQVTVDLGLVNKANYYTGVLFRGYIAGCGMSVLSGGRYDTLLGDFGAPIPATGFAVNVNATANALLKKSDKTLMKKPDVMVYADKKQLAAAAAHCRKLISEGNIIHKSLFDTVEETVECAKQKGICRVDCIDGTGALSTIKIDLQGE